jgi:hypothetical protein
MRRILLVESGSRQVAEQFLEHLRTVQKLDFTADVVTCYDGMPRHTGNKAQAFRVTSYPGGAGRNRLVAELASRSYDTLAILCTAEPIMTKWKWYLVARMRAKPLIVNENGDFFWFDRHQWKIILHFALFRMGLTGGEAVPTLTRLALLPLAAGYLLAYAAWVHGRRKLRILRNA